MKIHIRGKKTLCCKDNDLWHKAVRKQYNRLMLNHDSCRHNPIFYTSFKTLRNMET